jgi:metal-responsive CopG/Arc/MetJ family transcriptional regulator
MNMKRNHYRKTIPLQMITATIETEQAEYVWKRASNTGKSDSQVIREAMRKFIEHYDNEASNGRGMDFAKAEPKGCVRITCRIPIPLLTDFDFIFKANKEKLNRSLGVRIGIDKLMRKPIKI